MHSVFLPSAALLDIHLHKVKNVFITMNWQGSNMSGNLLALQTRKNSHYSANLYEQKFSVVTVASRICQFLRKNAFLLYGSLHSKVYCHHHSYPIQLHGIYLVKAEFTINHSGLQLQCYCPLKPDPSFLKVATTLVDFLF